MASKASMLKNGANKASSGLFAGMTPLSKEPEKKAAVKDTKSESKKTEEKSVTKKASEPKKVEEEKQVVEKTVESNSVPVAAPVEVSEEKQPVIPEPVNYTQPVQTPQYNQPQVQQMPVNQYQNSTVQATTPAQMPVYNQPQAYQQPVMMQQSPIPAYTEPQKAQPQTKQDKSRYEKEKFLLLDIRGYRDYVEHMAKASNMSATKYIRSLIDEDMKRNMDIYMAHKQLEETLKGRR